MVTPTRTFEKYVEDPRWKIVHIQPSMGILTRVTFEKNKNSSKDIARSILYPLPALVIGTLTGAAACPVATYKVIQGCDECCRDCCPKCCVSCNDWCDDACTEYTNARVETNLANRIGCHGAAQFLENRDRYSVQNPGWQKEAQDDCLSYLWKINKTFFNLVNPFSCCSSPEKVNFNIRRDCNNYRTIEEQTRLFSTENDEKRFTCFNLNASPSIEEKEQILRAAREGDIEKLSTFYDNEISLYFSLSESPNIGQTIAHEAAAKNKCEVLNFFNNHNYNYLLISKDQFQATPLHWAASHGHLKIVEFYSRNKLDMLTKNKDGCTPAHFAAQHKQENVLNFYTKKLKVDLATIKNNQGESVLDWLNKK